MRHPAMLAGMLVLTLAMPTTASFETPEDAVRHYLEGVASGDIDRVLEATAIDEMRDGYRFDQMVDRIRSFAPLAAGPVHDPFLADLQQARWRADLLSQTRMLAYSLLAPEILGEALEGYPVSGVDAAWAQELMVALDPSRLSGLTVADIALPEPDLYATRAHLANMARAASTDGADERTERVVLVAFENELYLIGFTIQRYGDNWKIKTQSSVLGLTPGLGNAVPTTVEAFEELTTEPLDDGMIDLAGELEAAGLIATGVDAEGIETWSLTPMGERAVTQLAMLSEADAAAMLTQLLDASAHEE